MDFTKKEIATTELRILLTTGAIILSLVLFSKYIILVANSIIGVLTVKEFVVTDFAFVLVFSGFIAGVVFVFNSRRRESTFIYVAENHLEVEPVDRRDEFLEMSPSYM